ncbi:MAG: penicillin-binding transpeptidase domain-containing protein [Verrucomicrobiales bacterium]
MTWFSPSRARLFLLGLCFAAAGMLLVVRLWNLQIKRRDDFIGKIPGTSTVTVREPATRGRIFDREGRLLVDNIIRYEAAFDLESLRGAYRTVVGNTTPTTTYDVPVAGTVKRDQRVEADIVAIFKELALPRLDLVGLAANFNSAKMATHYRTHRGLIPWIYRDNLDYEEYSRYAENAGIVPGMSVRFRPQRRYKFGAMASHILGYLKVPETGELPEEERKLFDHFQPDDIGASGIEQTFETHLRGTAGRRTLKKDEKGHAIGEIGYEAPIRGGDAYLTIDAELQMLAENTMRNVGRGAAVVLDVRTGDVLAMASVPSYDPNDFVPRISKGQWDAYTLDPAQPLLCTALGSYEPGSTYKIVSAIAGALGGKGKASYNCSGGVVYGGRFKKCWIHDKGGSHGTLGLAEAIQRSCNSYFYLLGNAVGPKPFVEAAEFLGFGRSAGLEIENESPGIVMGGSYWREVLRRDPERKMTAAELANMVIGQGETKATPVQIAVMTAAIANGGDVLHPRLVRRITQPDTGRQLYPDGSDGRNRPDEPVVACNLIKAGVPTESLETIRKGMWMAVNQPGGTAGACKIEGANVCGKTGSAQTTIRGKKGTHAWFMGFAPKDNPKYAICVVVLGGKAGGKVAAPLAREILDGAFALERDRISPGTGTRPAMVRLGAAPGNFDAVEEVKKDPLTGQLAIVADYATGLEVRPARLISAPAATIRDEPDAAGMVVRRARPVEEPPAPPPGERNP